MNRISTQYVTNSFIKALNKNVDNLSRLQIQISSGQQITRPSENVFNNALSMNGKSELYSVQKYLSNISYTQNWLDNTESGVLSIETAIQRARELAVQGANDTLVQTDRDLIAKEMDELINHIMDVSNSDVGGEFLFAGQKVNSKPFSGLEGRSENMMMSVVTYSKGELRKDINQFNFTSVLYAGNSGKIMSEIETGKTVQKNTSGNELFFRGDSYSAVEPNFKTLSAPLNKMMPLSVLNDGKGVQPGTILITDQNGIERSIDLSTAQRLDDVIYLINKTGSFEAGIDETPSDTAKALGLYADSGPDTSIFGQPDLAMQSVLTPLWQLNNGMGVPDGFLSINTRDGKNWRVDLTNATTVQDALDSINAVGGGNVLQANFNSIYHRLEITDKSGGTGTFSIDSMKNQLYVKDLPAKTAADMRLLSTIPAGSPVNVISSVYDPAILSEGTPLSSLNGGNGIESGFLNITTKDGTATNVDLKTAITIKDTIDLINASGANVTAAFDIATKTMKITDNTGGAGAFSIGELYGNNQISIKEVSTVAKNLGLLKSAQGNQLFGDTVGAGGLIATDNLTNLLTVPEKNVMVLRGHDDKPVQVDLRDAVTIQDVLSKINNTKQFNAIWDVPGQRFIVTDLSSLAGTGGIAGEEFTNTARDLGLLGNNVLNPTTNMLVGTAIQTQSLPTIVSSIDMDPIIEGTTELSSLNNSSIFNKGVQLGRIRITDKAGVTSIIDLRGSKTVQDVMDRINSPYSGLYIEAKINEDKNGLEIVDKNRGATGWFEIVDIDSTAAADLGISKRTIDNRLIGGDLDPALLESTPVTSLRNGGVPLGKIFVQSGDYTGEIDLSGAKTVGDIIQKLSMTDTRFNLAAWINSDKKGLNLSNTKNQAFIKVRNEGEVSEGSASALGLGGSRSLFQTLIDLRDNLLRGDSRAISERSIAEISKDLERVLELHSEVGARTNRVTQSKEKQTNLGLTINNLLEKVENIDMAEAITRMAQYETAYKAALEVGSRIMQTSLMDFLK
ncbi:MAG: flagellar hook-associated protein FlgL [Candidatus Riflebacteria bacterium]|nr:flagellar hook-associated protein FlgL [Candidatus Riflebacteria bacterium]